MRVTVTQAAKMIGASPEFVRYALREGRLPIGSAVKMSTRWTYNVQLELVKKYITGKEDKNNDTDI